MERYTTLAQYIDEQMEIFDIPNTPQNNMKLRVKFTRELKKLNLWENAKEQQISKTVGKVFTDEDLEQLSSKVRPYLLKNSSINPENYKELEKSILEDFDRRLNQTYEEQKEYEEREATKQYIPKAQQLEVMITALFEHFFEPLNLELWQKDETRLFYSDTYDEKAISDPEYILSLNRLKNPVKSYTKIKEK